MYKYDQYDGYEWGLTSACLRTLRRESLWTRASDWQDSSPHSLPTHKKRFNKKRSIQIPNCLKFQFFEEKTCVLSEVFKDIESSSSLTRISFLSDLSLFRCTLWYTNGLRVGNQDYWSLAFKFFLYYNKTNGLSLKTNICWVQCSPPFLTMLYEAIPGNQRSLCRMNGNESRARKQM